MEIEREGEEGRGGRERLRVTTPILEARTCKVRAIKLENSKTHKREYPNSDPPAISVAP
jgi:hypothetical protein